MADYTRYFIMVNDEFQINSYTDSAQGNSSVAALADGGFVVTWDSYGQDGSSFGVYGQRYTSSGVKVGSEFQINSYTANHQSSSSVTALTDGSFVVTWDASGQDGSESGVYGQRYTSSGVKIGGEFQINSYTTRHQDFPSVTALMGGGFVVTWTSDEQDGSENGVYGQRYTSNGVKAGGEFQINSYTDSSQIDSSVAALTDGSFVVTWNSYYQDGYGSGVYGQRYTSNGVKAGGEFQINSYTASHQSASSVAALTGGGFVVTWTSKGQDGSGSGVYGQRYTSNGVKAGGEFQINSYTASHQSASSVAALADGGFVVTWTSNGQDGSGSGVYGQRYTSNGVKAGGEFLINSYTNSYQETSSVTALTDGSFVVTWTSEGQDGSGYGVYGQRYYADGTPYTITFSRLTGTNDNNPDLAGTAGQDLIYGFAGNDSIAGLENADRLYGGAGTDTLIGNQGDDTLYGGKGWDSLRGSRGRDTLYGESGDDYLSGGVDSDLLYGDAGNDTLSAGKNADILFGGDGEDLLYGRRGSDKLYGDGGDDTMYGNQASDTLYGGRGNDSLRGSTGGDSLFGGEGNDFLSGGTDDDMLFGGKERDILSAGQGSDTLSGGLGADELWGRKGNDYFLFDTELGDGNIDTVEDFTSGQDHINLDTSIFTDLAEGTLSNSSFHSSADGMATENSHRILYNTTTGALFFDADGNGTGAAVQFALVRDTPGLAASDFIVVS